MIDARAMKYLKKDLTTNLFNHLTVEQRKELFEFIGEFYNFETGEMKKAILTREELIKRLGFTEEVKNVI